MSRVGTGEQSGDEEAPDQDSLSGSGVSVKSISRKHLNNEESLTSCRHEHTDTHTHRHSSVLMFGSRQNTRSGFSFKHLILLFLIQNTFEYVGFCCQNTAGPQTSAVSCL